MDDFIYSKNNLLGHNLKKITLIKNINLLTLMIIFYYENQSINSRINNGHWRFYFGFNKFFAKRK